MKTSLAGFVRLYLLVVATSALLMGAATAGAHAQTSVLGSGFSQKWIKSVPPLRAIALSPQGIRLALLTDDGKIAVWQAADAQPMWSVTGQNVNQIRVTDGVGFVLAYRAMDPENRTVAFFNADTGAKVATRKADGAIWDMAVSQTGDYAAFTTGAQSLYTYTLDVHPSYHRIGLRGIGDSVAVSSDEAFVACGLWNGSGVDVYGTAGNRNWFITGKASRRFDVSVAGNSQFVLATNYYNHNHDHPIVTLWTHNGKPVWTYDLGPDVSLSRTSPPQTNAAGTVTVISFDRKVYRGATIAIEKRMIALGADGLPLWRSEYGGPYLSPTFICFTPSEDGLIFYDSDRRLYRMPLNQNQTDLWQLSAPIRWWTTTDDNRCLVINTVDDHLQMLGIR